MSGRSRAWPWWREKGPPVLSEKQGQEVYYLVDETFFKPPSMDPARLEWYEPPRDTVRMPRFNMVILDLRDDYDE